MDDALADPTGATLKGKRVAILAADGFEQSELLLPRRALDAAGAGTVVIAPSGDSIAGERLGAPGESVSVDMMLDEAHPDDFDALLLPGGAINSDRLRTDQAAVAFVRAFFDSEKPVAAISYAPMILIEAGVLRDRRLTTWPSLETDIRNAGGRWIDAEVVTDRGLVTSRKIGDIAAFNREMIEAIADGAPSARMDRNTAET
jgi:protease I